MNQRWVTLGCGDSARIDLSMLLLTLSNIGSGVGIELGLGIATQTVSDQSRLKSVLVWHWWACTSRADADHEIKKAGLATMMHKQGAQATLPSANFAQSPLVLLVHAEPPSCCWRAPTAKQDTGQWSSSNVVQI